MDNLLIKECVDEFDRSIDRLEKLVRIIVEKLECELSNRKILARVSGRVKNSNSLENKLNKYSNDKKKSRLIKSKDKVFDVIGDLAAVRVMTYVEQDREVVAKLAREIFSSRDKNDFAIEEKEEDDRISKDENNFYRATHMQVCIKPEELKGEARNLRGDHCELQITSMLAHVWNEIEHDLVYKSNDKLSQDESVALGSLGLLTKSGDKIITSLISAHKRHAGKRELLAKLNDQNIDDHDQLIDFFDSIFGKLKLAGTEIDFVPNSWELHRALSELKLTLPNELLQIFTYKELADHFKPALSFTKFLEKTTTGNRFNFSRNSSDLLIFILFSKFEVELAEKNLHGKRREVALFNEFLNFRSK